ncbi:MAG: GH1 family beta-glucosidase [Acidimicrobiia bacterium]
MQFPDGFTWGVATSAYQIEGAANEDGRGESIWDRFSHTPGRTRNGDTGDIACDHYHRWPEDLALMADLGVQAYRFSISWPRILPDGSGATNPAGLDFYDRLIDELIEVGITPMPTLYHWDLPMPLHEAGGWTARSSAQAFAEYAAVVAARYGDRVTNWITQNEPWCQAFLSYQLGVHAPGHRDWDEAIRASHHLLLSHGLATAAIRSEVPGARVGAAINFEPAYPATDDPAALAAADRYSGYYFRWFLDPLFGRGYPIDMIEHYQSEGHLPTGLDFIAEGDLETIATPADFLGINYYTRHLSAGDETLDNHSHVVLPDADYTAMDWEINPDAFERLLIWIWEEYRPNEMLITENGCSYPDEPDTDGRVRDVRRISYLDSHLRAVHAAAEHGAPIVGYLQWSFMDNFEWSRGYDQRFGIVHVDFDTQVRTPKDSAYWYRDVIERNGLP